MFNFLRSPSPRDKIINSTRRFAMDFLLCTMDAPTKRKLAKSACKNLESSTAARLMVIAEAIRVLKDTNEPCRLFDKLWPKNYSKDQKLEVLQEVYAWNGWNRFGLDKLIMYATRGKGADLTSIDFDQPDWIEDALNAPSYWEDGVDAMQYTGQPSKDELIDFTFGQIAFGPPRKGCRYILPNCCAYQLIEYAAIGRTLIPAEQSFALLFPGFSIDHLRPEEALHEPVSLSECFEHPGLKTIASVPELWQSMLLASNK
jgi:hypothetical protein